MKASEHTLNVNEIPTASARKLSRLQVVWPFILSVLLSTSQSGAATPTTETVRVPITTARAEIQLVTSVGRLKLRPSSGGQLLDGTLDLGQNERLERTLGTRGDTRVVRLAARSRNIINFNLGTLNQGDVRWLIKLSPKVPLTLKVETGVGDSTFDLSGLKVTNLSLKGGVDKTTVILPATGIVTANIEGDIGEISVRLPSGMQARIQAKSDSGSVRLPGNFQRTGDTSTSKRYASSSNRVDLHITNSVGHITVEQAGR